MNIELQNIVDLEAIKMLKAKYFRSMDTKDWASLESCFTEDLLADFREAPGMLTEGRDTYMNQIKEILKEATTVHHGHMPEITFTDDLCASGIWAMDDYVELPGFLLEGWGHYHEQYRKEDGSWKISSIRLTRLRLLQNGKLES